MKIDIKLGVFVAAIFSSSFISCAKKVIPPQSKICMDTVCSVNLYNDGTKKLYEEIFSRLDEIEKQFSVTIPDSCVSLINSNAGIQPVMITDDVFVVLNISAKVSEISQGAFDVTADPVIRLWGINTDKARVPLQSEIDSALQKVGNDRMIFANDGTSWCILENGMSLNFGAVAKGYAADAIVQVLDAHEVKKAIIDLGGNIFCYGEKDDGSLWTVGIKNPENPSGAPLLKLRSEETSVVTSGIYERYLEEGGKRYHHIFDPKTGYPVENELASVTVICKNSTAADALSTACFVLGQNESFAHLADFENFFHEKIGLVFIHKNGDVFVTENLQGKISFYGDDNGKKISLCEVVEGEVR